MSEENGKVITEASFFKALKPVSFLLILAVVPWGVQAWEPGAVRCSRS